MKSQCDLKLMLFAIVLLVTAVNAQPKKDPSVFGVYSGSSPAGESVRQLLGVPPNASADLIQWQLVLHQHAKTLAPTTYQLRCEYGPAVSGLPGLGSERISVNRGGRWWIGKGMKSNPSSVVVELDGAVSLLRVDPDILHMLDRDRSLMIGTGGWSYTLYRADESEKPGDTALAVAEPSRTYTILPVATGPSVFGVFEGRSPCHGIARELKIGEKGGCIKVKWRITLYRDSQTLAPTMYRIEGSLHRQAARQGNWTIMRGTPTDPNAIVYRLTPTETEEALLLLQGDDNVLFFLDRDRKPLVGHAEFSYTLNRRSK